MAMEDSGKYHLRTYRDLLVDQLIAPLATTYPLPDLPVRVLTPVVFYNSKGKVAISFVQPDTTYTLFDESGANMGNASTLDGEELTIETKALVKEDYTFNVVATKTMTGLSRNLLQTVTIKVGVDQQVPYTYDPEFAGFNQPVTLHLSGTQSGAIYQVFDMKDQPLSKETDSGAGGDLTIITDPLKEDTQIKVKATNKKTKQTGFLVFQPLVRVYPNDALVPVLLNADNGIDFNTAAELSLDGAQTTTSYQLIYTDIDDDTVDKPSFVNTTTGKAVKGTTSTKLKTDKLGEDPTVAIVATKTDSGLSKTLLTTVFIPVKPDPDKQLSIVEASVKKGESATIRVNKPQRGIYYQLVTENMTEVGWRVYYHKNHPISKAHIGLDFAIGEKPDDTVYLPTGPLDKDTTFKVVARKATTGKVVTITGSIVVKLA